MEKRDLEKDADGSGAVTPNSPEIVSKDPEVPVLPSKPDLPSDDATENATAAKDSSQREETASIHAQPIQVPRSKRRGLFGQLTILPEITEPHDYPRKVKWFITFVIAAAAAAAPMGSAIFFPALPELSADLNTTPTITNLSVALYMLAMSIFPLWWSSFSETLGRRTIYLVSFSLFVLFNILAAISSSIAMLIVMRIFVGGSAASVQAVGAGTISDIWPVRERGMAMGIFYLGPLCGPLLAPIIGGALAQRWGWRSTMWFLAIWGGAIVIFILFSLPETLKARKPVLEETSSEEIAQETGSATQRPDLTRTTTGKSVKDGSKKTIKFLKRAFIDPLKVIGYLRYPAVLITVYYASITFGSLYVLNVSIQDGFSRSPYNFQTIIVGLLYIPNSLGYFMASILGGRWTDRIMHREARAAGRYDEDGKLIFHPEDRMRENAWIAAVIYPGALIWYGWTVEKGVFWLVPMIANFFFGVGSMLIFAMATTMLTEFMPKRSSSGVALNNFVRNIFSAVGGIVAQPLINSIGNGWLFTGLGVIAASSSVVVWVMRKYGPRWRETMDRELND
ncbi:MAG: hypothetical protein M4579_006309 [Chaenotheca gracillima]|nr:MAG: hypothetical protein M4579_006309 [Chaenotheca gracillima]